MFSFHKPRVYRSTQGCCICKAKSSSSRFTDSKKYETDFMKCFQLTTPRHGEICNACVLLVKRFKRLPTGSDRHWGHVVDARVGPGLKSMTKFKKRKEESLQQKLHSDHNNVKSQSSRISIPEKFSKIFKKSKKKKFIEKREETPGSSDEQSLPPPSPTSFNNSDSEENQFRVRHKSSNNRANTIRTNLKKINKRKGRRPSRNFKHFENINFFDEKDWICIKSCCGIVYENRQIGALMIDYETCVPCLEHKNFYIPATTINRVSVANDKKTENQQISNNNNHNFTIQNNNTNHHSVIIHKQHETNNNISMSLPALKKHHLFLKRQMENAIARVENNVPNLYKTESCSVSTNTTEHVENVSDISMSTEILMNTNNHGSNNINKQLTYLHKNKSDSGKVIKHSLDKTTNVRLKPSALNDVKNLVKICAEKSIKIKPIDDKIDAIPRNKQIDPTANKFSDNSSDSGYEENLQEQKIATTATIQQMHKGKVQSVVRPVILANGIKLHVQPQNLVLAANLAGISQSAMQQPHAQIANKINSQTDTEGNRAIYNISSPSSLSPPSSSSSPSNDGLAVSITGTSAITQMIHTLPAGTNLNQKIILVKAKYNNSGNQAAANN